METKTDLAADTAVDEAAPWVPPPEPRRPVWMRAALSLERFSGLYVLLVLVVAFSILRTETFATTNNARIILAAEAISAMLALALVLPLSAEVLDISVAATMGLSVVMVGYLQLHGVHPLLAVGLTLLCGLLIGAVNSLIVVRFKVSALIATLGMSSILAALAYWLTNGEDIFSGLQPGFKKFGQYAVFTIPAPVFYMLIIAAILYYVLEHTPYGRHVRAIGGNADAARLSGLRVERLTSSVLFVSAFMASLTGVVYAARLGTAPLHAGEPYLLASFAAVFLGSTQIKPGRFNVLGTLLAVYLLATGVKGLQLLYPNNAWFKQFFEGAALITAVALSVSQRRMAVSRAEPTPESSPIVHEQP